MMEAYEVTQELLERGSEVPYIRAPLKTSNFL